MLIQVLSISGLLFWAIIAFVLLMDTVALATEDDGFGGWAVFITVALTLFTILFTDAFIGINIIWVAVLIGFYLLLGVGWSFKKWIDYVLEQKRVATVAFDRSDKKQPFDVYSKDFRPTAVKNKQRIVTWMATWPLSFTWWVLTYPRHFFIWAYNRLTTVFDRVTAKIWDRQ